VKERGGEVGRGGEEGGGGVFFGLGVFWGRRRDGGGGNFVLNVIISLCREVVSYTFFAPEIFRGFFSADFYQVDFLM